jgi:hypothetical protein
LILFNKIPIPQSYVSDQTGNIGFTLNFMGKLDIHNIISVLVSVIGISNFGDISKIPLINLISLITSLVGGTILYTYFFVYVKNQGVLAYNKDDFISRWFLGILYFFNVFMVLVILPLVVYLAMKHSFIEIFSIIWFFMIYNGYFYFIRLDTIKVVLNYKAIDILNTEKILIQTKRDYINTKSIKMQMYIFLSTVLWAVVGILLNFNIITMICIELLLIICFSCVTLVKHIPNYRANIHLINGDTIDYVYIIDDTDNSSINIIKRNETQQKIMKSAIKSIDTDITTKTILTFTEEYLSNGFDRIMSFSMVDSISWLIKGIFKHPKASAVKVIGLLVVCAIGAMIIKH